MPQKHNLATFVIFLITFLSIESAQVPDELTKRSKPRNGFDFIGCAEIEKECSHLEDDLALMTCSLKVAHSNKTKLSLQCQHKVWTYQTDMLDSTYLSSKLKDPCHEDPLILDCLHSSDSSINCLIKKKPSARNIKCWHMVNKIENLIGNDWQITKSFLILCYNDIQRYSCGRIPQDSSSLSQTQTVKCLQNQQDLQTECLSELASLKEIKFSSLQMNKVVFAACSTEQVNFCSDEVPDTWLMYKCLVRHKYETGVSKRCQDQLLFDQRTFVMNYKMSKGLVKACKEDIRKYHCRKGVVEDKDVKLAQILLCLENVTRNDSTKLSNECNSEMIDHRKMLMDDYRLSPEVMQGCASDIINLCKGIEAGGKTIHCLMEHARPRRRKDKRISTECQKSLKFLMESVDLGEDWRVDPILRKACKPVVDKACNEVNVGNGRVMSCLMEKLGTEIMNQNIDCENSLMQIQYFISRDFKLDPQLFKACKYDAVTQCKASLQWADINEHPQDKDPLILPCLYKFAYNTELNVSLKPACEQQVRRVMRQRAVSVDLMPEIADNCIDDLSTKCFDYNGKGEEIVCLQNNIKDLTPRCKDSVTNFTEMQSGHIELNSVVNINCRVQIERICGPELNTNKRDDDGVMECLISHKNDPEIKTNAKCRAAIEHEQLISLKNYRFTRKFKNACKSYVLKYCPDAQTKSQVVRCLSEIVRNDTITRRKHTIFKDCRQQLRSQLFQQKENIDLEPELKEACKDELNSLCSYAPHGEAAALECLQTSSAKLSEACKKAIFVVKKQEFADNAVDFHLITSCHDMIDLYCHNTEPSRLLECLRAHKESNDFEEKCKEVVVNRLIEQNTDYRLNNNLQFACKLDIKKYCGEVLANEPKDIELEGKMLICLKEKFREMRLSTGCENEIANILRDQALNYRLDPLLGKLCKAEIQTICPVPHDSLTSSDGQVEECLKKALLAHKIVSAECARELVQIIEETEVDIDADPLLERACALDLLKYCKELEHGAGRRLKCLKIILNDSYRKLEPECEKELSSRIEMYKYVASGDTINGFSDMYQQISYSPSKKYFLIVMFSVVGLIFIFGLYCGRLTRRAMYVKKK